MFFAAAKSTSLCPLLCVWYVYTCVCNYMCICKCIYVCCISGCIITNIKGAEKAQEIPALTRFETRTRQKFIPSPVTFVFLSCFTIYRDGTRRRASANSPPILCNLLYGLISFDVTASYFITHSMKLASSCSTNLWSSAYPQFIIGITPSVVLPRCFTHLFLPAGTHLWMQYALFRPPPPWRDSP
jgi:hypothetical protein